MITENAIIMLGAASSVAVVVWIGANTWLNDRREQRAAVRYSIDADTVQMRKAEMKQSEEHDLKAGLAARKLTQEKELALKEMQLADERSRHMAELGQKGRTQRQINSDQDEAMMEALGGLVTEYVKPNADKEMIKAQAMEICKGNVVTLLRLLKKMGIDPRSLM